MANTSMSTSEILRIQETAYVYFDPSGEKRKSSLEKKVREHLDKIHKKFNEKMPDATISWGTCEIYWEIHETSIREEDEEEKSALELLLESEEEVFESYDKH